MLSTLMVVLPIFALIFAGWLARRIGVLGPHATAELNRFVVFLALPALLFDIIAHARWEDIWQPGFIAAFGLSSLMIFGTTVAVRLRRPRHLADAAIDGLNAGYANTGFIGFPLALLALGRKALAPTMIATLITVCLVFAIAIILIEVGLQTERRRTRFEPDVFALAHASRSRHLFSRVRETSGDSTSGHHALAVKVGCSLLRNPLLVAPVLGALVPIAGQSVPAPLETFLKLLGGAASPCALVTLGLFLASEREKSPGNAGSTALLVGFKLLLQPVIAWVLAAIVLNLSPLLTHAAVLLAALPTGTGPFMLAELYRREAAVTSRVILVSTVASLLTVSLYLALAG
ncbi:MAG TPA: AEC family transporter [Acetobacteraceae bacterium]|nr:AEC family transporter [Acetobacteraceae bacterium]